MGKVRKQIMSNMWIKIKSWFCTKKKEEVPHPVDIRRRNSEPFIQTQWSINRKLHAGHTPHPKRIREDPALEAVLNARRHSM
jgi:hypothetical protein